MTTTTRIEAAGATTLPALNITAAAPVEIRAAEGEGKRPTFEIVGYTGAAMNVEGFYSPVIVELSGLVAERERIPILLGHDRERVIGQATPTIDSGGVRLSGTITGDDDDARKVVTHAKNGFEWQASIGASVIRQEFVKAGEKAVVNGREVHGPILIAREARLYETSFVSVGADSQTSATVAASNPPGTPQGAHPMFEQWLQAKGFDPTALNDVQKASLKAAYDAEQAAANAAVAAAAGNGNGGGNGGQATPPGHGGTNGGSTQTLDEIVAARRAEDARVAEITRITAEAINARPMLVNELEAMARAAIEARTTTPTEFELHVLRATRASVAPGAIVRQGDRRASIRTIEAAVCLAGGLEKPEKHFDDATLNAASDRFPHGIGLRDLMLMAARENGYTGYGSSDVRGLLEAAFRPGLQAQGWSTVSLPGIFTNTANKFLVSGFNAVEDTWRAIAARGSVRDFKARTSYSLTGGAMYEKVGPGGELKHGTLGELSYTNRAETYGRMFAITRQDIINDDLGALTEIPRKLGRGAALKLNDVFWAEFMDNAAFFTAGRGNYIEGASTNLQLSSLTTGETSFMDQTDEDGYPVAITPRILLVPNALAVTGANLMNSTMIAGDTTANTVTMSNNPHAGKFRVVQSSYLSNSNYTGYSTTAWYLLADPSDLAVIEVVFLNGREQPVVESADADFNSLGIQFRGYHDFGCSLMEFRAGLKSKGAA
jgi:phage head maturation protease